MTAGQKATGQKADTNTTSSLLTNSHQRKPHARKKNLALGSCTVGLSGAEEEEQFWLQDHWQGMLGSSEQAGGRKKSFSPTKARASVKVVGKSIYTIVLLTIAAVTGATGTSDGTLERPLC